MYRDLSDSLPADHPMLGLFLLLLLTAFSRSRFACCAVLICRRMVQ